MLGTAVFRFGSGILTIIGLLGLLVVAGAAPNPVSGPKKEDGGFQTSAPYAILIDAETGTVLFEKSADELTAPSSLAKLMTAEVVFNEITQGRLKPRRRNDDQRERLAPGRRALAHVQHVRADPQPGQGGGSPARADHPVRQRRLRSRLREGISGNERAFAVLMNNAGARTRPRQIQLRQFDRPARPGPESHRARARQARPAHHPHLSGLLSDLRREGVHLEQDPPAEPQSAARAQYRRRRHEDRLHRGGRVTAWSARPSRTACG